MDAVWAYFGEWAAFLSACRELWPEVGVGALIVSAWSMMRRRLPHVRRWVIKHDRRHYIDSAIIIGLVVFVAGSAYIDLYRATHIEQDLVLHFDTKDYKRLFEEEISFDVYANNNGNRNILVQDISLYALEYQTETTLEAYAVRNKCLTLGLISPHVFSMSLPNGKFMNMNGILTQHVTATAVYRDGKENKLPSFSVGPKSSQVSKYIFNKLPFTEKNGNRLSLCFGITLFDAKANQVSAVCKGPEVTLVPANGGTGTMTMPAIGQYKLLPNLDPATCEAAR